MKQTALQNSPLSLKGQFFPSFTAASDYRGDRANIPVDQYFDFYKVGNAAVQQIIREFPTLCFSLGKVREDSRSASGYILEEGSGMFALENKADADTWKGIFNHVMGTSRQVYFMAKVLSQISEDQKRQFAQFDIDPKSFEKLDPELLRDYMLASHVGRRASDESKTHGLFDKAHLIAHPEKQALLHLWRCRAPKLLVEFFQETEHSPLTKSLSNGDVSLNIASYCDWTFGQKPETLAERFASLRQTKRGAPEVLDLLEAKGRNFEQAVSQIVGEKIIDQMLNLAPYDWEEKIRTCYWLSSQSQES